MVTKILLKPKSIPADIWGEEEFSCTYFSKQRETLPESIFFLCDYIHDEPKCFKNIKNMNNEFNYPNNF